MKRLFTAAVTGATLALLPLMALAADPPHGAAPAAPGGGSRGIPMPGDLGLVVWLTAAGLAALFLVFVLGYLYRRQRGLDWAFQAPAVPHDDHHPAGHDDEHAAPAAATPAAAAHGGGHH